MILQPDVTVARHPVALLDLSENLAPLPSAALAAALRTAEGREGAPGRVRGALARAAGVAPDQVLPANGSLELIHRLCRAAIGPGTRVAVLTPTFGEFGRAAAKAGAQVESIPAAEADGFQWRIPEACDRLRGGRPDWVFLCNPNNPTGGWLERAQVEALVSAAAPGRLVLDEAYIEFVDRAWDALPLVARNVVVLRSITKLHGMVVMQFGHLIADAPLVARLEAVEPQWEVNAFAAAAALSALADSGHAASVRAMVRQGREALVAGLRGLGRHPLPSVTNFLLVRVPDSRAARWALLRERILVKDGGDIGLPGYLRISVPRPDDVPRVTAAFRKAVA